MTAKKNKPLFSEPTLHREFQNLRLLEEGEGVFPGGAKRRYDADVKLNAMKLQQGEATKKAQALEEEIKRRALAQSVVAKQKFEQQRWIPTKEQAFKNAYGHWRDEFVSSFGDPDLPPGQMAPDTDSPLEMVGGHSSPEGEFPGTAQLAAPTGPLRPAASPVAGLQAAGLPAAGQSQVAQGVAGDGAGGTPYTIENAENKQFDVSRKEASLYQGLQEQLHGFAGSPYTDPVTGEERTIRDTGQLTRDEMDAGLQRQARINESLQERNRIQEKREVETAAAAADWQREITDRVQKDTENADVLMAEINRSVEEFKAKSDDPLKLFGFYDNEVIDRGEAFSGKERYTTQAVFKPWAAARTILAGIAVVANSIAQIASSPKRRPPNVALSIVSNLVNMDLQAQGQALQGANATINQKMTLLGRAFELTGDINKAKGFVRSARIDAIKSELQKHQPVKQTHAEATNEMYIATEKLGHQLNQQNVKNLATSARSVQDLRARPESFMVGANLRYKKEEHEKAAARFKAMKPMTIRELSSKQQAKVAAGKTALGGVMKIIKLWRLHGKDLHNRGILKHLLSPSYNPTDHKIGGAAYADLASFLKGEYRGTVDGPELHDLMEMHDLIALWAGQLGKAREAGVMTDADFLRYMEALPKPDDPFEIGMRKLYEVAGGVFLTTSPAFQGMPSSDQNKIVSTGIGNLGRMMDQRMSTDEYKDGARAQSMWLANHELGGNSQENEHITDSFYARE
jgi:hypothetical protein